MRSITRPLVFVALAGSFALMWMAHTDPDVVVAQTRKPITMTRIYTGSDGQSHAEEIEMKLNGNATEMLKATGVEFSRRAPFFFSSRRRHTRLTCDWSSDVCSSD